MEMYVILWIIEIENRLCPVESEHFESDASTGGWRRVPITAECMVSGNYNVIIRGDTRLLCRKGRTGGQFCIIKEPYCKYKVWACGLRTLLIPEKVAESCIKVYTDVKWSFNFCLISKAQIVQVIRILQSSNYSLGTTFAISAHYCKYSNSAFNSS